MKLGVSSYTFTWAIGNPGYPPEHPMDELDLLNQVSILGVEVVQVADNLPLHALSTRALDAFGRRAEELGILIEIGTRGVDPDHLRTYLALAQRFRSPILRLVIDTPDHHPAPVEVVAALRSVIPAFEQAGVCLALENHDRFKTRTLVEMADRIAGQINSPAVGFCLDTSNSFSVQEGPEVVVANLAPRTVNLHLKDFVIRRFPHMMGFTIEGRPVGQGQLDIPWLLGELRQHGRNPNIILEQWTLPEADLASTIAKEASGVAQSLAYLRGLL
jgi:sugar phosphate isomerase/epimerase